MIITVTLNPAIDKTVEVPDFSLGGLNRTVSSRTDIGGKGINVAKVVRALGYECVAAGILFGQSGRFIGKALEKLGITCDFVYAPGEVRTNIKINDPVSHITTELNESGPKVAQEVFLELRNRITERLMPGDIIVFSGSVPPGTDRDIYREWIGYFNERGAYTILDADGDLFRFGMEAGPAAVKPNLHELGNYFGRPLDTTAEVCAKARELFRFGSERILVSMGERGAVMLDRQSGLFLPAMPIRVNGTVGAGDAMVAALAVSRARGDTPESAMRLAVACAAASVMKEGTGTPSFEEVNTLLGQLGRPAVL